MAIMRSTGGTSQVGQSKPPGMSSVTKNADAMAKNMAI
jgi:hypothetical protein